MTGMETARLISALERELPSRRNDDLPEQDRAERLLLWSAALKDVDYMGAMKKMPGILAAFRWFPRLAELLDAMNAGELDALDILAEQGAAYRTMFRDWTTDGLNHGQRMRRMGLAVADSGQGECDTLGAAGAKGRQEADI